MKSWLKLMAFNLGSVLTTPLWLFSLAHSQLLGNEGGFKACAEFLSLIPGRLGIVLRCGFYRMCIESITEDCSIGFGSYLTHRRVRLGHLVYIGNRCMIGSVEIGDNTLIGSNVDILSGRRQHSFEDRDEPIREQVGSFRQLHIGANVWIGNSAVVMDDIGDGSVIGAGSVVVKAIGAESVAVGNPASVIRHLDAGSRKRTESILVPETGGVDSPDVVVNGTRKVLPQTIPQEFTT